MMIYKAEWMKREEYVKELLISIEIKIPFGGIEVLPK